MTEFLHFGLLGLGVGGLYAFAAQGLVLVYRGSGVLNFAHGAIGISAAYMQWELHVNHGQSYALSFIFAVLFAAAIGVLIHMVVMRRLRTSSALVRVVATLGLLILLQGIAVNRYGGDIQAVTSALPQDVWHISNSVSITSDRIYLLLIAVFVTGILWWVYRATPFGLATSAVAENQRSASALGLSPDAIAAANWALGCGLAGTAAILMAPITALSVQAMTRLLLATLAAALIGNFSSFALTLVGGLAIGIVETELGYYASQWGTSAIGLPSAVPFFIIIALLVVRGRALPLRDFFLQRQPAVGSGRVRPGVVVAVTALAILVIYQLDASWADAITTTFTAALIMLSIVVVTGYAGQISLGQFAIAGFGGWVAARAIDAAGFPFWAALLVAVLARVPLGMLFALPAVRTRGINLAIVTLGLGSAIEFMLFANGDYTGGAAGTDVGRPTLFGWEIDAIGHPQRYATVCLVAFVLCALVAANVRRGRSGRRLLAVRTNERAAAALGISVVSAKLYAFSLAAGIAAVGGILMLFRSPAIVFDSLTNFQSILFVGLAVIGGIGFLRGPWFGGILVAGALGAHVTDSLFSEGVARWLQVFSGAFLILMILQNPDGIVKAENEGAAHLWRKLTRVLPLPRLSKRPPPWRTASEIVTDERRARVAPRTLEVRSVTVRYGAVIACDEVTLTIEPGKVVGLIGPNGAGKTTLVDAITGFTPLSSGSLTLDGEEIARWSAVRRARAGISRSFQSLELFEDMTVLENLRTASEPRDVRSYLTDLVYPVIPALPAEVVAAISEFGFEQDLERKVEGLPYGERRLLAIARAVATEPSVLLLDEPAAGLTEVETRELAHLVRRLADEWGMAVLLIEHDVNFVMSVCDHIVVLDFGLKISEGPPEVVRNDEKVIAAYLGHPAEVGAAEQLTEVRPGTKGRASTQMEGAPLR